MAYGSNPGNSGPSGDYFDDGNTAGPAEEKEEHAKGETAIVPKSLMAGKDFKVGEEIVFKITAIHENDFEVEYSYGDDKEHEGGKEEPAMEPAGAPAGEEMMS